MTRIPLAAACAFALFACACDRNPKPDPTPTEAPAEAEAAETAPDAPPAEEVVEKPSEEPVEEPEEKPPEPKATKVACIDDPRGDGARRHDDPPEALAFYDVEDLDGDGAKELTVASEGATGAGDHILYLSNEGCWIFGGQFVGYVPDPLTTSTDGKLDFGNYEPNGCMNMEGSIDRYAWDGTQYTVAKSIYCTCPGEEEEGEERHPDCPEDR